MSQCRYLISRVLLFRTTAVSSAAQTVCAWQWQQGGSLLVGPFHFSLPKYKAILMLRNSWFLRKSSLTNANPIFSTHCLYCCPIFHVLFLSSLMTALFHAFKLCLSMCKLCCLIIRQQLIQKQQGRSETWKRVLYSVPQHLEDVAEGKESSVQLLQPEEAANTATYPSGWNSCEAPWQIHHLGSFLKFQLPNSKQNFQCFCTAKLLTFLTEMTAGILPV